MKNKTAAIFFFLAACAPASAHVKWFAKMANCANTPLVPHEIFSKISFLLLGIAASVAIGLVFAIDEKLSRAKHNIGSLSNRILGRNIQSQIIRFAVSIYFLLLPFYYKSAPIILTPELKTNADWIPYLQLCIGLMVLSRRATFVAVSGIVMLYGYAVAVYGWYHLLDYVFFFGIAAFLAADARPGLGDPKFALAVLRVATGLSFLWVSVEKWSYPEWTYEILAFQLKDVLMGFRPEFFVMAAGFVEFCLAFLLIYGRASSQVSAAFLALLLVTAMPAVGPVDAIGHLPLVAVLILLAGTKSTVPAGSGTGQKLPSAKRVILFVAAIPGMTAAYYLAHELAYDGSGTADWAAISAFGLLAYLLFSALASVIRSRRASGRSDAKG